MAQNSSPPPGKPVRKFIILPPMMAAALTARAAKNGVSETDYIRNAIHEAMDRDIFAEIDAENGDQS